MLILSASDELFYKIDKQSGKVYDEGHASLVPPSHAEERAEDEFEELTCDNK